MGFLDKLKPVPRWKHADPAVRLEAVRELEDRAELAILAETDPDARVRRAAIPRTLDAEVLGRVASGDADPETRDRAADRLAALATASSDAAAAVEAVRALADPRRLSAIARSDAPEMVRTEALSRTADERALGGIARSAKHEGTAAAALARVTDQEELTSVAENADHKDVALAAFERLVGSAPDIALIRAIETRTGQKAVAKRARAIILEAEAAEAARLAAIEDRKRRENAVIESVERLALMTNVTDVAMTRADFARATEAWTALEVTDQPALDRFAAGVARVEAAVAARVQELAEADERNRQRAEAVATSDALCARVETLDGDDVLAQLVPIEEEWRSLSPLVGDGPEAAQLAERFARAVAACRKRHEMGALVVEARASYEALVSAAEGLVSESDTGAALTRWQSLNREARGHASVLQRASRSIPELDARMAAVGEALTGRQAALDAERKETIAKAQAAVVAQIQRLTERGRRFSEAETVTLREGDRLMRDIGNGLEDADKSQASREISDAAAALRKMQEQVAPRVRELREMDDWRRFANAQQQERLIGLAEAIVSALKAEAEQGKDSDLGATARALKELHAKWQEVAEAPRNSAQRLWDRFRGATDFIRARCEPFFQKMRDERVANIQRKAAIVEEAEALAASTDWAKSTARFRDLQKAWQESGLAPRDTGRELAQRFRTASNTFFTHRREDLATRKKVWTDNLAKKDALVARAEALAESTDWDAAAAEFKRMQNEWKTVGPVRRSKSEDVWQRFRAAADLFFERFHNRHQIALFGKLAEREAMVVDLETLAASENGSVPSDLAERVQQMRTTWNRAVPIPVADARTLADRWQAALAVLVSKHSGLFKGTELDSDAARQRLEKLADKVEAYLADAEDEEEDLSPTEALAARLRNALASNAMGGRGNEGAKWRAAAEGVKEAQASWARFSSIGKPDRELEARFKDACRRVNDHAKRHSHTHTHGQGQRTSSAPPRRTPPRPTSAMA